VLKVAPRSLYRVYSSEREPTGKTTPVIAGRNTVVPFVASSLLLSFLPFYLSVSLQIILLIRLCNSLLFPSSSVSSLISLSHFPLPHFFYISKSPTSIRVLRILSATSG
jgi:hypothetical protein